MRAHGCRIPRLWRTKPAELREQRGAYAAFCGLGACANGFERLYQLCNCHHGAHYEQRLRFVGWSVGGSVEYKRTELGDGGRVDEEMVRVARMLREIRLAADQLDRASGNRGILEKGFGYGLWVGNTD